MEIIVNYCPKNRRRSLDLGFLACTALLCMPGSASANEAAPRTVWAKAGVSYEQYRDDGLECGMKGLASNIDNSAEVKTLARASRQLESLDMQSGSSSAQSPNGLDMATSRAMQEQVVLTAARPEKQYARIKEIMFHVVRSCMIDHGYAKIVLTEDQRKAYGEVKGGADARRAYIHKLASDPHVLEKQREVAAQ